MNGAAARLCGLKENLRNMSRYFESFFEIARRLAGPENWLSRLRRDYTI